MMRHILSPMGLIAMTAALSACATSSGPGWVYDEERARVGRIYNYERSNTDGSRTERVSVFHKSSNVIEVYKENGLCQNAALVSADMDWSSLSAPRITGGALLPDAQRREFAFLNLDPSGETLEIVVKFPDGELTETAPIRSTPWHLYDFDFASLTIATPHLQAPEAGFSFGMALVWADPSVDDPLVWMGDVEAAFEARVVRLDVETLRFALTGEALAGALPNGSAAERPAGTIWLDANDGHIVDAVLPVPNHPGYADFRLKLLSVSDGGDAAWTKKLRAHFENCG